MGISKVVQVLGIMEQNERNLHHIDMKKSEDDKYLQVSALNNLLKFDEYVREFKKINHLFKFALRNEPPQL